MTHEFYIVGLMSGTSADGVDAALVRVQGSGTATRATLEAFKTESYTPSVRQAVLRLATGRATVTEVAIWHYALGEVFAEAALAVSPAATPDFIALHGQTVSHVVPAHGQRATLQLASSAVVAERTGCTVVSDFRAADIAAGGQGAPLVSFVDWLLFRHPSQSRVVLNVGGIANVTFLPPRSSDALPLAFDTGPGNAPLDAAMTILTRGKQFRDDNGLLAAEGHVDPGWLEELLEHPFFEVRPPKSTGLESFGFRFAEKSVSDGVRRGLSHADILATLTMLTARSIAISVHGLPPAGEVVISGGGRHNVSLLRFLRKELEPIELRLSDEIGIPGDAKEAFAFAVLGNQTMHGLPGTHAACTGAREEKVLGSITPGANFVPLMARLWQ